jgi:hypothetical protein
MFTTTAPSFRQPGGLVQGHSAFDLFHLVNVAHKCGLFVFRRRMANFSGFVWFVIHNL